METPAGHDAIKYSTSQTAQREANEAIRDFRRRVKQMLASPFGGMMRQPTHEELVELHNRIIPITEKLAGIVESMHWPVIDYSNSRLSDELAWEQAHRHLNQPTGLIDPLDGIPLAWSILRGAIRKYAEWRDNDTFRDVGINLDAYFWAELHATIDVIERHHHSLAQMQAQ